MKKLALPPKRAAVRRTTNTRGFLIILAIVFVPAAGMLMLQSASMRPDLSHTKFERGRQRGLTIVDWTMLDTFDGASADLPAPLRAVAGTTVRAVGYMLNDGPVTGGRVKEFLLSPETGTYFHPAHQIPNQIIRVVMRQGPVDLLERRAVWVDGTFLVTASRQHRDDPLYLLQATAVGPWDDAKFGGNHVGIPRK